MKFRKQNCLDAAIIAPFLICGFAIASPAATNDPAAAISALKAEIAMLPATDQAEIQELNSVISKLEKQVPPPVNNGAAPAYVASALPLHNLNGMMNENDNRARPTPYAVPETKPAEAIPDGHPYAGQFKNENAGTTGSQPPDITLTQPQNSTAGPRAIAWGGADFASKSFYSYIGSVQALSGQNIESQDGFLIRESAGYGSYKFKKATVAGGEVSGNVKTADLMLGYKKAFDKGGVAVYVGGSIENHDLSSNDAGDSVNGTHEGFASSADAQFTPIDDLTLLGMGSYASANRSYWSHFAMGYALKVEPLGPFKIGPTIGFSGGKDYSIRRYGAALTDINIGFANMYTYAGYGTYSNDTDSIYGGLGLGKSF